MDNVLELTRQDIDQMIRNFRVNPSADLYSKINSWYEGNLPYHPDQEYMICVYLFIVGANIRHRFQPISYDQHINYVKDIRTIIDGSDSMLKAQRKIYLDLGIKSGAFRQN